MKIPEKAPDWTRGPLSQSYKLLQDKAFLETLRSINNEYLYWDKVKYKKTSAQIAPELLWTAVKLTRQLNNKFIGFGKHLFTYNLTDSIQRALHEFDLNIGGSLAAKGLIPDEDKKRYLISSIMEEAISSSQIEGAVTTRQQAKEMLRKNAKPRNRSEQMISNNYATIRYIVEIQAKNLDKQELLEIHRLITNNTLDDSEDVGKYRTDNDVQVLDALDGEIAYTPPDFHEIENLMEDLFVFFNSNSDEEFIHPIVKACIIHFLIGYIHPFADGNGRTARALFYWYMLKNGYWLTEYLSISRLIIKSKSQYARAFLYSEIDHNDLTYFISYKVRTMRLAYQSLREYISRKLNDRKELINFQRIKGINDRQALILKWLCGEDTYIFNVREIQTRFSISNQTARTDLTGLVELGYLEEIDINRKTKGFVKAELFNSLIEKELRSVK